MRSTCGECDGAGYHPILFSSAPEGEEDPGAIDWDFWEICPECEGTGTN